jgi:uncharacterized protein (TIGR02246 family)
MPATTPAQVHALFRQAFQARDVEALLALCEPEAVLAPSAEERFQGHDAIREGLGGFLALEPDFVMEEPTVVLNGDLALLFSPWHMVGTSPDGDEVRMAGVTADLVRQQGDGNWLFVMDNPFGGSQAAPTPAA